MERAPTATTTAVITTGTVTTGTVTTVIGTTAAIAIGATATGTSDVIETATTIMLGATATATTAIAIVMGIGTDRLRCAALRQDAGWGGSGSLRGGAERPARRSPAPVTARSP
ncbi:MAG TPA: hypothetical protein VH813_11390 [Candidatus Limnocylindrales bacterium]